MKGLPGYSFTLFSFPEGRLGPEPRHVLYSRRFGSSRMSGRDRLSLSYDGCVH